MGEPNLRKRVIDNETELGRVRESAQEAKRHADTAASQTETRLQRQFEDHKKAVDKALEEVRTAASAGGTDPGFQSAVDNLDTSIKGLTDRLGELYRYVLGSPEADPPPTE